MERLAIEGGEPVRKDPWPTRIQVDDEELEAVVRVLKESMEGPLRFGRYSSPSRTEEFEEAFARLIGVKYAVASSSGTASIHTALGATQLEPGSEVITSPITDPGTVAPILFQNLIPVFADVDPETLNLDPDSISKRINERTKAIIPVHLAGTPCKMDVIMEIAQEHDLLIIEDCAQAHGATYGGRMVGSLGDLGCFSLMGGKHITSGGEGGMTVTNDEELWRNAKSFADKGKAYSSERRQLGYPSVILGLNYRMNELQAAIGLVQLRKLPRIVAVRRRLCQKLAKAMEDFETISFMKVPEKAESSYWFCHFRLDLQALRVGVDRFAEALRREGIPVGARYIGSPIYEWPFLANRATFGRSQHPWTCNFYGKEIRYEGSCPKAKEVLGRVITLSIHEGCTDKEIDDTILALEKVEKAYRL
ncbi:MAG: DegT/DnrJ/EryC1/StrS family aminotransferase [Candidatus Bathyarchaeia archaeon]